MHDPTQRRHSITFGLALLAGCDPAQLGTIPSDESTSSDASQGDASQGDASQGDPSASSDPTVDPTNGTTTDDPTDGDDGATTDDPTDGDDGTTGVDVSCDAISSCDPQPDFLSQGRATITDAFLPAAWTGISTVTLDVPCSIQEVASLGPEDADITMICEGLGDTTTLSLRAVPAEVVAQFPVGLALRLDLAVEDLDAFDGQSSFLRLRAFDSGEVLLASTLGQQPGGDLRLFPEIDGERDAAWYGVAVEGDDQVCAPEPAECENLLLDTCGDPSPVQRLGVRVDDTITVVDANEGQAVGSTAWQIEVVTAQRTANDALECPRSVVDLLLARR